MFYHRYFTTFPVYLYICIVNDLWENHVKIRNLYLDEIEFPLLISFFLSVRFYTIHKWDVQISDGSLRKMVRRYSQIKMVKIKEAFLRPIDSFRIGI